MDWSFPLRMNSHHKGSLEEEEEEFFRHRRIFPLGSFYILYTLFVFFFVYSFRSPQAGPRLLFVRPAPCSLTDWVKAISWWKMALWATLLYRWSRPRLLMLVPIGSSNSQQQRNTEPKTADDVQEEFWYITRITRDKERKGLHRQK